MDTDDLSDKTYKNVILEAEKFSHDLTLHYGMLASECKNENEYLEKARGMTLRFLKYDDFQLRGLFFGEAPDKNNLHKTLNNILENIQ